MASFTSVQDGKWHTPATWGQETAIPGKADSATIAHVVTVESPAEVGSCDGTEGELTVLSDLRVYGDCLGYVALAGDTPRLFLVGGEGVSVMPNSLAEMAESRAEVHVLGSYKTVGTIEYGATKSKLDVLVSGSWSVEPSEEGTPAAILTVVNLYIMRGGVVTLAIPAIMSGLWEISGTLKIDRGYEYEGDSIVVGDATAPGYINITPQSALKRVCADADVSINVSRGALVNDGTIMSEEEAVTGYIELRCASTGEIDLFRLPDDAFKIACAGGEVRLRRRHHWYGRGLLGHTWRFRTDTIPRKG